MKIIDELVDSGIKANKKDSFATKMSIFLATLLLGTVVFIIGFVNKEEFEYMKKTIGDYQVEFVDVDSKFSSLLKEDENIEKVSFSRFIEDKEKEISLSQSDKNFWSTEAYETTKGRPAKKEDEIIVPTSYLIKNKDKDLGSTLKIKDKVYKIVGEYDNYGKTYSFENVFYGYLDADDSEKIFTGDDLVYAYLWYKNPRDTYRFTDELIKKWGEDKEKLEEEKRVNFNKAFLEYKLIFPRGIIPPKNYLADKIFTYAGLISLVLLFAVMIYGAFNVWNSRDLREIALLKSVGMTSKQVKKMIRKKALKISLLPIFLASLISYFVANLLLYLMYWNNYVTYKNISDIMGASLRQNEFKIIVPPISMILLILVLAFLTVFISAILPAIKSSKLNIVEGLNSISQKKTKVSSTKIGGKVEQSLARDYFSSYKKTYKVIIAAMTISAFAMTLFLIPESYKKLVKKYDSYKSPYNFEAEIMTDQSLDQDFNKSLEKLSGFEEKHIVVWKDFNIPLEENRGFFNKDLLEKYEDGSKYEDELFAGLYGLKEKDFIKIKEDNKIDSGADFVLLNKIPSSDKSPYSFRDFMPVKKDGAKDPVISFENQDIKMKVDLGGELKEFPFDLDAMYNNGVYIFTSEEKLNKLISKGKNHYDLSRNYKILVKSKNQEEDFEKIEKLIASYIPKGDYYVKTEIRERLTAREEKRNNFLLIVGIQTILLLLALSNAYNSFYGNLRARRREFNLLSTVGMTEKQMKKMIFGESKILFGRFFLSYIFVFILAIIARAYRSKFELGFAAKELLANLSYLPIIIIFAVMALGIFIATKSGIKEILQEDVSEMNQRI